MTKRDEFIKLSQSQVGYAETGSNITKYSKYFDTTAWQWFNTKKQGGMVLALPVLLVLHDLRTRRGAQVPWLSFSEK